MIVIVRIIITIEVADHIDRVALISLGKPKGIIDSQVRISSHIRSILVINADDKPSVLLHGCIDVLAHITPRYGQFFLTPSIPRITEIRSGCIGLGHSFVPLHKRFPVIGGRSGLNRAHGNSAKKHGECHQKGNEALEEMLVGTGCGRHSSGHGQTLLKI
jgi:hypothetical protein